jgi:outer membrane protein
LVRTGERRDEEGVDQAYYATLRGQSVLKVADETVKARETVLEQISALEKSGLKSGLDVTFAQVNLDQAKLLLLRAQNDLNGAYADLTAALAGVYCESSKNP